MAKSTKSKMNRAIEIFDENRHFEAGIRFWFHFLTRRDHISSNNLAAYYYCKYFHPPHLQKIRTMKCLLKYANYKNENITSCAMLGRLYFEEGKYQKAIQYYKKAVMFEPVDELIYDLGAAYARAGNYRKACELFKKAYEQEEYSVYLIAVIFALIKMKKHKEADDWIRLLERTDELEEDWTCRNELPLLHMYYCQEQYEQVVNMSVDILEIWALKPESYAVVIDSFLRLGKYKEAKRYRAFFMKDLREGFEMPPLRLARYLLDYEQAFVNCFIGKRRVRINMNMAFSAENIELFIYEDAEVKQDG